MNDESAHNTNNRSDRKEFFEQFPADESKRFKKIWDISAHADPELPDVEKDEIEEALSAVHRRIKVNDTFSLSEPSHSTFNWIWISAAAAILLIFAAGMLLIPQTATAPYGELTSLTLPDGSQVELNSGSRLSYNRLFSFTNRSIRLDGEAFFSVRKGDHPFIVHANGSTVRVTGTKFNVRSWSEEPDTETEVAVSEGNVLFHPAGHENKSVTIAPGQLSRWSVTMKEPTDPKAVTIDQILGWRDQKLIFNNKPLGVIFKELERRFDVEIQLKSTGIIHETLTTYYAEPQDVASILKDICMVKGLRYAKTANGYQVYK